MALAHEIARLPRPLVTLPHDDSLLARLAEIVRVEGVKHIIVGLPRNMDGSVGFQAEAVQEFVRKLKETVEMPIELTEETLSSVEAQQYVSKQTLESVGIDAVAAAIILERYLESHEGIN